VSTDRIRRRLTKKIAGRYSHATLLYRPRRPGPPGSTDAAAIRRILWGPPPPGEVVPEPSLVVTVSPPATDLDAGVRTLVIDLLMKGKGVLLVSSQRELRDRIKERLLLEIIEPVGAA
jgi:hypothetical protein